MDKTESKPRKIDMAGGGNSKKMKGMDGVGEGRLKEYGGRGDRWEGKS